jgi:hypothetical protein
VNTKTFARKALLTTVLVGSLGGVGAGVASAATTDAALTASTASPYQSACDYTASVRWDRAANQLSGTLTIQNHETFKGCRKNAVVTFTDDRGMTLRQVIRVNTAGSTWDLSTPARVDQPFTLANAVPGGGVKWIDHLDVAMEDRPEHS